MTNLQLKLLYAVVLLLHAGAFYWAFLQKRGTLPVTLLTLFISIATLIYGVFRWKYLVGEIPDYPFLALLGFELAVAIFCMGSLAGLWTQVGLLWGVFGLHATAALAMMLFALFFRMTRIF